MPGGLPDLLAVLAVFVLAAAGVLWQRHRDK